MKRRPVGRNGSRFKSGRQVLSNFKGCRLLLWLEPIKGTTTSLVSTNRAWTRLSNALRDNIYCTTDVGLGSICAPPNRRFATMSLRLPFPLPFKSAARPPGLARLSACVPSPASS